MTDNDLYRQLLGLTAPWQVYRVDLNVEQQEVRVYVRHDYNTQPQLPCPECGQPGPHYDSREERVWRHLDSCQFKTFLVAQLPRVECKKHGVKTITAPWCEPHSRFTLAFECFAIAVLSATGVQSQAASLLRLSPDQVQDIMARAVRRGLERRDDKADLTHLSLDEKSFRKGHHYITVLGDSLGKGVLEVVEGRTLEATKELLVSSLSPAQREKVASVSMDMWPAFASAKEQVLPQAEIVHDRFHIAGYLNEAVDKTRRDEHRSLAKQAQEQAAQQRAQEKALQEKALQEKAIQEKATQEKAIPEQSAKKQKRTANTSPLSQSKWLWLRSPEKLSDEQKALFKALHQQDLQTSKVWAFKETFRSFYSIQSVSEGEAFFSNWYAEAVALGNEHLTKVANMLQEHLPGLLAYLRHRTSNAIAEGLNSQIQLIKSRARGYHRCSNFRIAILFFLGKLDMNPQKTL